MAGYISYNLRLTKEQVAVMLNNSADADKPITADNLISIDYAYHCEDENYDNGLSFLDRLHWKLSMYFPIDWTPQSVRSHIMTSGDSKETYSATINQLLTQDMIDCYGV